MHLQTARALKTELRAFLDSEPLRARTAQIALGIAYTARANEFAIAVRAPSERALPHDVVELLRARTANEIDVRVTGEIAVRLPATVVTPDVPVPFDRPRARVGRSPELHRTVPTIAADRLKIGASIGHYLLRSAGTLGFFARNSDGVVGLVSNNHVIAAEDRGEEGDDVLHPARADRGARPKDVVAILSGSYPRLRAGATLDCAFARLRPGVPHEAAELPLGEKLQPSSALPEWQRAVAKVGRTTLLTYGRIVGFEVDGIEVHYHFGVLKFAGQIEIESSTRSPFTLPGDSGSMTIDPEGRALGLIFANSPVGGSWRSGLTYAHPIDDVLRALDVTLLA